jgi:hypothetical protein
MTHHHCSRPLLHSLLARLAIWAWILGGACVLIPRLTTALTQSGPLAWLSVGLSLTAGTVLVRWLAYGHCQPVRQPWGLHPLAHASLMTWILRKDA